MYKISVPAALTSKTYDREKILSDLRAVGAGRIFLSIGALNTDGKKQSKIFKALECEISYFKSNGIETGVWLWAFMVTGESSFTPITGFSGAVSAGQKCPLDEDFIKFMSEKIEIIAKMHPDLIMLDDDMRFGFLDSGCGCLCEKHRAAMEKIMNKHITSGGLFEKMFKGKKNEYRSAYLRVAGESLKNFCRQMRAAADKGAGKDAVRLGACSCMSVWDTDGVDSYTLARILAGGTKPFVRLIGAPYWAAEKNWGNRLEDIIELERMERSWCVSDDIEIFSEADSYPRPRYRVPASYLEIFDTALRADGKMSGILKYMFDYTSSRNYERGYIEKHLDNLETYKETERIFSGKAPSGVRVYESMNKLEDADFSETNATPEYIQNMFFSPAARVLAGNTIPTAYYGQGCAGIAFGENARHLPEQAFEKTLIIDIIAAKILFERGVDIGIESFGDYFSPAREFYTEYDEYTSVYVKTPFAMKTVLKDKSVVRSVFQTDNGEEYPSCYTYCGKDGKFVVYTFRADTAREEAWRNYCRQRQIAELLGKLDSHLPIECFGNPDMYTLCSLSENSMAIGLWNCHADYAKHIKISIRDTYGRASFYGCSGKMHESQITIERIGAYEYGFILLEKTEQ